MSEQQFDPYIDALERGYDEMKATIQAVRDELKLWDRHSGTAQLVIHRLNELLDGPDEAEQPDTFVYTALAPVCMIPDCGCNGTWHP